MSSSLLLPRRGCVHLEKKNSQYYSHIHVISISDIYPGKVRTTISIKSRTARK
eukprot:06460.XXX_391739_391897_1 [CDS] Oithona nana genome sequencing.